VWVAGEESGTISRIDPRSNEVVDAIQVGNGPSALAVGLGAVWSANRQDGTVSRIDPVASRVTDTVTAGRAPAALAIAGDALWVADATGAVRRLDPHTRRVTHTVRTGASPAGLVAVDGALWVTAVAPPGAHRGGTLRVASPPIELDPAFGGYDPNAGPVNTLVYEGLLAHRRAGGAAGGQLVGALAVAVPNAADGGRRYVFRLRPGSRYSDGTPVRARDFRLSMERALAAQGPKLGMIFDTIDGAARCRTTPPRCDLSRGIVTDDTAGTVTIRLRRPDPNLLGELTLTIAAVVPPSTPRRRLESAVPTGTGPYRISRLVPGRAALLTRNPYFQPRGPDGRPAGVADRIEVTMGEQSGQITAVERGRLDVVSSFGTITGEKLAALRTRIGSRVQSGSYAMTAFAWLNVQAAPFDDPRVRRALNLAVDRGRVVDLTGGTSAGSPTCQLLPPGLPGYRPICPFTLAPSPAGAWTAPDRAEAERLIAASGTRGTTVELWTFPDARSVGRQLVRTLRDLGFRSRLRVFDHVGDVYAAAADQRLRPQIGFTGWIADSAEPAGYLRPLVSCTAYRPGDPASTNLSRFCDRRIDAAIDRAEAAGPAASAAWRRIERRIAKSAPVVSLVNPRWVAVTSPRTGNVQFHPLIGILLDKIWVR
jgi:peptide/nickel transport system substrate-binding protein